MNVRLEREIPQDKEPMVDVELLEGQIVSLAETRAFIEAAEARPLYEGLEDDPLGKEATAGVLRWLATSRFGKPLMAAMLGVLTVGAAKREAIAEIAADATKEIRAEYHADAVDARFHQAAQDVLKAPELKNVFSPEELQEVSEALASFDARDFYTFTAEQSGMDVLDVSLASRIEGVHMYSVQDKTEFASMIVDNMKLSIPEVMQQEQTILGLAGMMGRDGGFYHDGHIFINADLVKAQNKAGAGTLREVTQEVMYHEAFHGAGGHEWGNMTEGMVEKATSAYVEHIGTVDHEHVVAYQPGVAAAEVLYYQLGENKQEFWKTLVSGDVRPMFETLAENVGVTPEEVTQRLERSEYVFPSNIAGEGFDSSVENYTQAKQALHEDLQPLIGLLNLMETEERSLVVNQVNKELPAARAKIHLVEGEGYQGVLLVDGRGMSGIHAGYVGIETTSGTVPVILSYDIPVKEVSHGQYRHVEGVAVSSGNRVWTVGYDLRNGDTQDTFSGLSEDEMTKRVQELVRIKTK